MRYIKTHNSTTRTIVHHAARNVNVYCDEYATIWSFSARIFGWQSTSAKDWRYKKSEYKTLASARQAFLSDLALR